MWLSYYSQNHNVQTQSERLVEVTIATSTLLDGPGTPALIDYHGNLHENGQVLEPACIRRLSL